MGNFCLGSLKWYWVFIILIVVSFIFWILIEYLTLRMNNFDQYAWWSNGKGREFKHAFNFTAYIASKESRIIYSLSSLSTPPLARLNTSEYYFIYNYLAPLFRNNIAGTSYGCLSPYNLTQSIAFSMDDPSPDPRFAAWINSGCGRRGFGGGFLFYAAPADNAKQLYWYQRKTSGWQLSPYTHWNMEQILCDSCGGSIFALEELNKNPPFEQTAASGHNAQYFCFYTSSSSYWAIPYWDAWEVGPSPTLSGPLYGNVDNCSSIISAGGLVNWNCDGSLLNNPTRLNPTGCSTSTSDPANCTPYGMALQWFGLNPYNQSPDTLIGPYPGTQITGSTDPTSWMGLVMEWANGGSGALPANGLGNATTYKNLSDLNLKDQFSIDYGKTSNYNLTRVEPNLQFGPTAILTEVEKNSHWYPASLWGFQMMTDEHTPNWDGTMGGNAPLGLAAQFSGQRDLGANQALWWMTPNWPGNGFADSRDSWSGVFYNAIYPQTCGVGPPDTCNVGIGYYLETASAGKYKGNNPCDIGGQNSFPMGVNLGNVAWYRGYCVAYYTSIYTTSIGTASGSSSSGTSGSDTIGGYIIYSSYDQVLGSAMNEYCTNGSETNVATNTVLTAPVSNQFGAASFWMCSSGQTSEGVYNWNDGYADNFLSRAGIMPTSTQLVMWFNAVGNGGGACSFLASDNSLSCVGFKQLVGNPTSGQPGGWVNFLQSNLTDDVDALYNVIWGSLPVYIAPTPLSQACHQKKSFKKQKKARGWQAAAGAAITTAGPTLAMAAMMPELSIPCACIILFGVSTGALAGIDANSKVGNDKMICVPGS